ncbi:MAG TPA: hypothetical protein VH572_03160 [Gaiella sp.]
MRVLVTGSSGRFGTYLQCRLLAADHGFFGVRRRDRSMPGAGARALPWKAHSG